MKISIIKEYLKNPKKNYLKFNIKYTKEELEYLDNLNINKSITFDYYGNIDKINYIKLNDFIKNIGDNENIEILCKIVQRIFTKVTKAFQTNFCWLTVRVTMPNQEYDIPRWHKDGNYFKDRKTNTFKFLTVLKGPGTLFIKKSKYMNEQYYKYLIKYRDELNKNDIHFRKDIRDKYRKVFIGKFKDLKINQVKTRQGLIFITGDIRNYLKDGLLHSEPKKNVPRFFISILPGTENEIEEHSNVHPIY